MFELFSTLLNGIPVVFADEEGMNNPDALAQYITENGANILHCTPSRLLAYLEEPSFREAMRSVDIVLAAGEAFTQPLLDALHLSLIHIFLHPQEGRLWQRLLQRGQRAVHL